MVKTILWYLFFAIIVVLIILWFVSGGVGKVQTAALSFQNPLHSLEGGSSFVLPWEVPIPQGPDISNLVGNGSAGQSSEENTSQAETFGNPSPYENEVTLSADGATASDPNSEYVTIQNGSGDTLDMTGWSLQSALTGARSYIPRGASFFALGALNTQTDIELAASGSAVVTTGSSPVGTSFRENECSGYLDQLQTYTPPLESECPSPSGATAQAQQYGQDCADFVSSLSSCTFPQDFPSGLSAACQQFAQTNFSYNGCVQAYQSDPSFASNNWRIYLGAAHELWNNDHDTIRLLDTKGQVVAVTSY